MASARPSRRTRSWTRTTVAAGVAVAALSGCSATNPITTAEAYNVVDGVQAELGSAVRANNLLVFTSGEGEVGTMSGALSNQTREDVTVTLTPSGSDEVTIDVPARGTVLLGADDGESVEIERVEAAPGSHLRIGLATDGEGSIELEVPVFDGTLPEYAEMVPEAD